MDLKRKLEKVKTRENSGSIASNRFDYQKDWAITKLIELSDYEDFLLAFEYHEDIIVFNSSEEPNAVDFYQIKTKKSGKHTISSLLNKKNGSSILGKLFGNKINFEDETGSLNIVTNCDYGLKNVIDGELSVKICCNKLDISEKTLIAQKLAEELDINWVDKYFDFIFLEKSELTIQHHSDLTQQKLNKHIEKKYEDIKFNPSLAYSTIFDEVKRRNNVEKNVSNFDELIKYKSITKADFDNMIRIVSSEPNRLLKLKDEIINRLDSESASLSFRRAFKKNWNNVEIEYLKQNNNLFKKILSEINLVIQSESKLLESDSLQSTMSGISDLVMAKQFVKQQLVYSKDEIDVMILKELCDE